MIIIFVLNHGQSFTERGFSINKLTSDVNMEEESLIAQRVIYDALSSANADAATFPISKQMRESCKKARQRQKLAAEQKKSDEVSSAKTLKRKLKGEEVKEMKKKKLDLQQTIETLRKSLNEEAIASAAEDGKAHATKAAAFAKALKEKERLYEKLCGFEKILESEYKALLS